ncbi:hypothetical protein [Actibacterium lipolyticum]|uniref:hypothetical protein n=1 Tax=Actibacterium lipolyticum TaxID=1524263 RepID=UPI0011323163|nr:hypothetical protein [Actibacterium lipolyticum]
MTQTQIPAIPPFGIEYRLFFQQPVIDLHPDTKGFALPPGPGQFSLQTEVRLTVGCQNKPFDPKDDQRPILDPISTTLKVCARGQLVRVGNELALQVDDVMVKDIRPETLGAVLSCILKMILREMLQDLRIPYRSIFIQIGTLVPVGGITVEDDTAKAFANII